MKVFALLFPHAVHMPHPISKWPERPLSRSLYPGYKGGLKTPVQHRLSLELARCSNSVSHSNKLYFPFILSHVWKFLSNPHTDHDKNVSLFPPRGSGHSSWGSSPLCPLFAWQRIKLLFLVPPKLSLRISLRHWCTESQYFGITAPAFLRFIVHTGTKVIFLGSWHPQVWTSHGSSLNKVQLLQGVFWTSFPVALSCHTGHSSTSVTCPLSSCPC